MRRLRSLAIDPEFDEHGFAIGWHFAVPAAFKDCLDIRRTERKEDGKTVLRWTQGPFYCFATPNQVGEDGSLLNGQVQFQIFRPGPDKSSIELIDTCRLTQNDFVEFLKTGELAAGKLLSVSHSETDVPAPPAAENTELSN
jgi:hypothetical protein